MQRNGHYSRKPPSAFRPKNSIFYVIKVADSEFDFDFFYNKGLVCEIVAFYHFQENALCQPRRRDYAHLVPNKDKACPNSANLYFCSAHLCCKGVYASSRA